MASLYRRHRPRTFDDVVGQEHVVRTLRNAVDQDRVHHAYLFVGSRGTGKTSMAKILAASLNCERGGPTTTPCGECDSCASIHAATSMDVIEMDAASNNSVDDVRDLREKVAYAPLSGRHKVYILDEAHMLSSQAWNAFLKTLEEPPPNTVFVLATTEAAKVLPTVTDRCHRFDFSRPTVTQIAGVLRRVADVEGIEVPDAACALVARSATGSFRDALGTLEQLVSYSGAKIALEDVLAVLGAVDADLLFGTVDAVASGQTREALLAAARLAETGRDPARFIDDLEAHLRALMIVQVLGEIPAELSVTAEQDERLAEQAGRVSPADVTRLLDLLAGALRAKKDGADARTQLELALVKAAEPARDPSVKALLARIERLEGGSSAPVRPAVTHAPDAPATAAGQRSVAVAPQPSPAPPVPVVPVAPPPAPPRDGDLIDVWPAVLQSIHGENQMLAAVLEHARPTEDDENRLLLTFPESDAWFKRKAEDHANREIITEAVRSVTGRSLALAYELRADTEVAAAVVEPTFTEDELIETFKREFEATELPPEEA